MPTVNPRVEREIQSPNCAAAVAFQGTSADDKKDDVALFDDFEPTHQTQSTPETIRAADVPLLFHLRVPHRLGSCQPNHCANEVNGIRHEPIVRHTLDFGTKPDEEFENIDAQVSARRVFFTPINPKANADQVTSFDVKTGIVSSLNLSPNPTSTQCTIATDLGFAIAWTEADETGSDQQFISHIDANTHTLLWTKPVSDKNCTVKFMQQTASGDIVALCNEGRFDPKIKLCRLDRNTGAPVGPQSEIQIDGFLPIAPKRGQEYVFYCDKDGTSLVLPFHPQGKNDETRLYAIDFINQEVREVGDLPFAVVTFTKCSPTNGKTLFLKTGYQVKGHSLTFDADSSFNLAKGTIDLEQVHHCDQPLISNTTGNLAVQEETGRLVFYKVTEERFELIKKVDTPSDGLARGRGPLHSYMAMTKDDVFYFSEVTGYHDRKWDCRLRAFDASTGDDLWSTTKTFDGPANLVVNDDGSISWFTANGGVILAAP